MKFSYSPIPEIKSKSILAPLVPITFIYKLKNVSAFALVDSGAARAVVSTVIADDLGIRWEKIPVSVGLSVGGTFRSHKIENMKAEIFDHSFTLALNIVEGLSPYTCILGQTDIFKRAKITFEGYKKQFEISFREYN